MKEINIKQGLVIAKQIGLIEEIKAKKNLAETISAGNMKELLDYRNENDRLKRDYET